MDSVWSDTAKLPNREQADGDFHTEVLIIGGGMTGLLCALRLGQAGVPYVLVEADRICGGVTKNTTAKITSQHGLVYDKMLRRFGTEYAKMYLEINERALAEYRNICRMADCDFEEKDNFVYSKNNRGKLERELRALEKLGCPAEFAEEMPLPFSVAGAVKFPKQAQVHPLKFAAAFVPILNIYEHTKVQELTKDGVVTNRGVIRAEQVIVATHFPFINKHGNYFIRQYQHRSYVTAYEKAGDLGGMYVDEAKKGMSFRNYKDLLLIGGGGGRTGKHNGNWREISRFAAEYYPQAEEKYRWAAQDCMTLDGIPYIGQYSPNMPGFYVATGYNKWGMTSSMAAAMILSDLVMGKENPYAKIFSPARSILRPQLLANVFETTVDFLTPTAKRCPHLGCALKWNEQEHSWDCPCHGSRFGETGTLIDNPATDDLSL